jgi:hypothetical protein
MGCAKLKKIIFKFLKLITPPIFITSFFRIKTYFESKDRLFDGDDNLFKKYLKNCQFYAEYGCGKSTNWVLENTNAVVYSVDTSNDWVKKTDRKNNDKLNIKYVNVGEIGPWGTPLTYKKSDSFKIYTDWIWSHDYKPKCVLIDGRFRVCCFLTSLKFADEGTVLIFDDYIERPYYHIVEKYIQRTEFTKRQCIFIVPNKSKINLVELDDDIANFRYVID